MRKSTVLGNNRGSILVGAVALAILTAIGGMGFLMVSTNGINNETAAYDNEKAFAAAESGVWLGTRWLRDPDNDFLTTPNGDTLKPFGSTPVSINGMNVVVTIPVTVTDGIPVASIIAKVYSGEPGPATFKKRISVGDVRNQGFGVYCTFYSGYQPTDCNAANWNGTNWRLSNWGGFGDGRNFYGRTHFDSMPVILYTKNPRFYGPITVSNRVTAGLGATFENGQRGNDYSSGVVGAFQNTGSGYSPSLDDLNAIFTDRYTAKVDPIALDIPLTNSVLIASEGSLTTTNLPFSSRDDGYGPYQYRPTLYINGQRATYYYNNGTNYDSSTWEPIDGRIFVSDDVVGANTGNNLNVYTSRTGATGRFTIATAPGRSIVPVGNIVTSDYNFATGTIDVNSNNVIGLISGGYIAFNKTWIRWNASLGRLDTPYVSVQAGGPPGGPGTAPGLSNKIDTLHMTAAIMAVCHFTDNLDDSYGGTAHYSNFPMSGTEWWDGMWGPQHPSPDNKPFNNIANKAEDYSFQLYGNHILAAYARTVYGNNTRGCQGTTTFKPDPRMTQRNMQPPGFPGVRNDEGETNLLTLVLRSWSEENKL